MQDEVFADIYIEIFPFWENISDGDRDYICRNSYHCIDTRADRPVYGVCPRGGIQGAEIFCQ